MTKKISEADLARVTGLSNRKAAEVLGTSKDAVQLARTRARHAGSLPELPDVRKPKILCIDLETRPNLAYVWGLWNQNVGINQIVEQTEVICFGARWLDEEHVEIRSTHHDGKKAMIDRAWELLNEADAVMGWNSQSFDVKHLNREFLMAGLTPPSPYVNIDLMRTTKANFKFPSNKLDWVAQSLEIGEKVKHEGFTLWTKCMAGDKQAWLDMYTYQAQDVDLLVDLYYKLRPWIKNHPNMGLFAEETFMCSTCTNTNLQENGVARTPSGVFQQYLCHKCGSWSKGKDRLSTTELRKIS